MIAYVTLWDERIDGGMLPPREHYFLARLLCLIRGHCQRLGTTSDQGGDVVKEEPEKKVSEEIAVVEEKWDPGVSTEQCDSARRLANEYLNEAWLEVRRLFPTEDDSIRVLDGPVGKVVCDGWYQVYLKSLRYPPRVCERLKQGGARLLFDRFLLTGLRQGEFGKRAGLKDAQVTRLFRFALGWPGVEKPNLSLEAFQRACEGLGMVLTVTARDRRSVTTREDGEAAVVPSSVTARERHLWALACVAARALYSQQQIDRRVQDACRGLVAFQSGYLYGVNEPLALDHLTNMLFGDMIVPPHLEAISPQVSGEVVGEEIADKAMLSLLEPGLRRAGPIALFAHESEARILGPVLSRGVRWLDDFQPTETPLAPRDLEPAQVQAASARVHWQSTYRVFERWQKLAVRHSSSQETWEAIHPSLEQFQAAQTEGWSPEEFWHLEHCSECAGFKQIASANLEKDQRDPERFSISRAIRLCVFMSKKQQKRFRDQRTNSGSEPRKIQAVPPGPDPRVLDVRFLSDRALGYRLIWQGDRLVVSVCAKRGSNAPELIFCSIVDGRRRLDSCFLLTQHGPVESKLIAGECEFRREQLEALTLVSATGDLPLEFNYPRLDLIHVHNLVQLLGGDDEDSVRRRRDVLKVIIKGPWNGTAFRAWGDWVEWALPWAEENPTLLAWLAEISKRQHWDRVRAVTRLIDVRRKTLRRQLEGKIDQGQARILGKYLHSRHAWIYECWKSFLSAPGDEASYRAAFNENVDSASWVLQAQNPSIVRHVYESSVGYYTNNSKACPYYWNWKTSPDEALDKNTYSALAAPIDIPALGHSGPALVDETEEARDEERIHRQLWELLGVAILETDDANGFNAAQVADLTASARMLAPDLLSWKHLTEEGEEPCPWHPNRGSNPNDQSWHAQGLLEEVCYAIAKGATGQGGLCSLWYLDWKYDKAFQLATTGYAQEYSAVGMPLRGDRGRQSIFELAEEGARRTGVFRADEEILAASFPSLAKRGLLLEARIAPVFWGEASDGSNKPTCMLFVHCSQYSASMEPGRPILPDDEEMSELAKMVGHLLGDFQQHRLRMSRVWLRQHSSVAGSTPRSSLKQLQWLLKSMFQADDSAIWVRDPSAEKEADRYVNIAPPWIDQGENTSVWNRRVFHQLQVLLRRSRGKPNVPCSVRLYDSREFDLAVSNLLDVRPVLPTRMLACGIAAADGSGEWDLVIDLRQKITTRPFTQFTQQLLAEFASAVMPLVTDWQNALQWLRTVRDDHAAVIALQKDYPVYKLPVPNGPSISTLAEHALMSLLATTGGTAKPGISKEHEVVAKLWFAPALSLSCGRPVYQLYTEQPGVIVLSPSVANRASESDESTIRQECMSWAKFSTWIGDHLGNGIITLGLRDRDTGLPVRSRSNLLPDSQRMLEDVARYLSAVFSKENERPEGFEAFPPPLRIENAVEQLRTYVCRTIADRSDATDIEPNDLNQWVTVVSPDQEIASWPLIGESGYVHDDDRGLFSDLDVYGVRIAEKDQLFIPLDSPDRSPRGLVVSNPEWMPLKTFYPPNPAHFDSVLARKAALGTHLVQLCRLVGRSTGYWNHLLLGLKREDVEAPSRPWDPQWQPESGDLPQPLALEHHAKATTLC